MEALKTKYRKKIDERNENIYKEWCELMAKEGAMKTSVYEFLKKKYRVSAASTICRICQTREKMSELETNNTL